MKAKELKLRVVNEIEEGKFEIKEFKPYMTYESLIGCILGDAEILRATGLVDKNGKEIYEGDILKFYNDVDYILKPSYTEVIFDNGAFYCKHFKYGVEYLGNMDVDDMDITVGGNVYENPELLKEVRS